VAHQKWQPADPLVTGTFWKTRVFEPPLTDRENSLAYVVAFDEDGSVRDVTRRYAKAYTAKTLRLRVESAEEQGARWWRKALRRYARRGRPTDLDQIEDNELAAVLAREPIPRNIADLKRHPLYVLERHLRRSEVLRSDARDVGTVAPGPRAPLERVYLRRDVMVVRSKEKWYRMGRIVKPNEIPAKWLPPRKKMGKGGFREDDDSDDGEDGDAVRGLNGTPLYLIEHTEEFRHPPVIDGIVPKNKFGNIDVYVPSMVPVGGIHIHDELGARAAFILGVDYAPALTGFKFKGRHGTAVLRGVVVAAEYAEAVRAVIQGLVDMETEMEEERKRRSCLRMWRRLLMGLRIRQKIWEGVDEEREAEVEAEAEAEAERQRDEGDGGEGGGGGFVDEAEMDDGASDVTEEYVIDEDDYGGGGFFIE